MGIRLPLEYQEVEYIQCTTYQYIDTGINLSNSNFEIFCRFVNTATSLYEQAIFSIWTATHGYWNCFIHPDRHFDVYTGAHHKTTQVVNIGNLYDVVLKRNANTWTVILNNETVAWNYTPSTANPTTLKLCRRGDIPSYSSSDTRAKVYSFSVKINDSLVADYVPCYRKSDNEPGMYDLVSKAFFTNQGTGEFLVGPNVGNYINPRLVDRRRILIAKLTSLFRYIASSETGLVNFDTNIEKPMEVTCEFGPQQDLHDMPNPYPGDGNSTNLIPDGIDTSNGYVSGRYLNADNTTVADANNYISEYFEVDPSVTYTWSNRTNASTSASLCFYDENKAYISGIAINKQYSHTFTPPQGAVYARSTQSTYTFQEDNPTGAAYQLEVGSAATEYSRYSNICPISGWDGVNIYHAEQNLMPIDIYTGIGYNASAGSSIMPARTGQSWIQGVDSITYSTSSTYTNCSVMTSLLSPGTYRFSLHKKSNGSLRYTRYVCNANFQILNKSYDTNVSDVGTTLTLTRPGYIAVHFDNGNTSDQTLEIQLKVEIGNVESAYTPYMGRTLPIIFNRSGYYSFAPIQEGTGDPSPENVRPIHPGLTFTRDDDSVLSIYGGTLTVNADGTADIVATYGCKRFTSSDPLRIAYNDEAQYVISDMADYYRATAFTSPLCMCTAFPKVSSNSDSGVSIGTDTEAHNQILFRNLSELGIASQTEWNTFIDNNIIEVTYPFADFITYTLSVAETNRALEALGLNSNTGTLYGGTVTINPDGSADVAVMYQKISFDGSENWTIGQSGTERWFYRIATPYRAPAYYLVTESVISNKYPVIPISSTGDDDNMQGCYLTYNGDMRVRWGTPNLNDFKASLMDIPLEYVYPLATPQTYHFSNVGQLNAFLGQNNVWSDFNGSITTKYYKKQQ